MRTVIAQRIQRRALANRYPVHVQEKVTSKTMGHVRASVERGECRKRQVSAARGYGSSDGEDPGLGAYGISSYYSTLCEEGKQSRGTWQCDAKDSEEKNKTEGKLNSEKHTMSGKGSLIVKWC